MELELASHRRGNTYLSFGWGPHSTRRSRLSINRPLKIKPYISPLRGRIPIDCLSSSSNLDEFSLSHVTLCLLLPFVWIVLLAAFSCDVEMLGFEMDVPCQIRDDFSMSTGYKTSRNKMNLYINGIRLSSCMGSCKPNLPNIQIRLCPVHHVSWPYSQKGVK